MCIWVDFNDDQAFWGTINNDEAKNYKRAWNNQLSFLLAATPAVVVKGSVVVVVPTKNLLYFNMTIKFYCLLKMYFWIIQEHR